MFLRLWQFQAAPGHEAEFEVAYGPDGAWARLFQNGAGYLGTELLRGATGSGEYVTIDRWESEDAWTSFHNLHRDAFASADAGTFYEQLVRPALGRLCVGSHIRDVASQSSTAGVERGMRSVSAAH